MMFRSINNPITTFEHFPDEILLLICRYLSQINVLDSFSNLNNRLTKTISSYRERIFLSHLSSNEFDHFIDKLLGKLAPNVCYLYINNSAMLHTGKVFERTFSKIDQQFPLLRELVFHQIDVETLENLSWRFNTMHDLRQLSIDIAEDRLSSMPIQFDEFLCGKLFSSSNSFESLTLNFNRYRFTLHSLTQKCENLHYLTISVKSHHDLLILFDRLPHLEQLNITIGCSTSSDSVTPIYPYEHLWWKVAYLTKFHLTIEAKELTSHDNVLSNEIILEIIRNLHSLLDLKFELDVTFSSLLQLTTTKEVYAKKYLPYVNGSLWEHALKRNDHRMIRFQLYVELDGMTNNQLKRMKDPDAFFVEKPDVVDFKLLLETTFSTGYWLQKNIAIQCFTVPWKHVSIYTLPLTKSSRSTTVDIIDQEISVKSSPSHVNIQYLSILSNSDSSPKLSMIDLFAKYPCLLHLRTDTALLLPPTPIICSNHLRSLSLNSYSLFSCCQLLEYLPQITSLSIASSFCERLAVDICSKSSYSIRQFKLIIDSFYMSDLSHIKESFPNIREFYLTIKSVTYGSFDDFRQCERFERLSNGFVHLRYMEISLPIKQGFLLTSNGEGDRVCRRKTSDGHHLISKQWF